MENGNLNTHDNVSVRALPGGLSNDAVDLYVLL